MLLLRADSFFVRLLYELKMTNPKVKKPYRHQNVREYFFLLLVLNIGAFITLRSLF